MLKIAVIDDEAKFRELMEKYLQRYSQSFPAKEGFSVTAFDNAFDFLDQCGSGFDLVFMDIEMPDLDGMTAAKRFRETDTSAVLVFITNLASYAIHGYEVNAFDYILKPLPFNTFCIKLERCLRSIQHNRVMIPVKLREGGMRMLNARDIRYVEVSNVEINYHTEDGTFQTRGHLKDTEPMLAGAGFSRCSNSCLVNLRYVAGIDKMDLTIIGGDRIQISRPRRKEFLDDLTRYIGRNK